MSQIPAMPIYWDAYLADTTHLTTEEHGAYLLLLAAMWRRNASVPDDDKDLARITGLSVTKWRKVKARLNGFLVFADGEISQKKLEKTWKNCSAKIEKNRANGALGGRPKVKENKDIAKANGLPYTKPDETIPEPEPEETDKSVSVIRDFEAAFKLYNQTAVRAELPKAQVLTDTRKSSLKARLKDCGGLDGWEAALSKLEASDYCTGKVNGWKADLDFVLQQKSFTRLMEGSYDNRGAPQQKSAQSNTLSILRGIIEDDDRNTEPAPQDHFDRLGFLATDKRD